MFVLRADFYFVYYRSLGTAECEREIKEREGGGARRKCLESQQEVDLLVNFCPTKRWFFLGGGGENWGLDRLHSLLNKIFHDFAAVHPKVLPSFAVYAVCFFKCVSLTIQLRLNVCDSQTLVFTVCQAVSQSASQAVNPRAKTSIFNFDSASRNTLVYCARSESEITT